MAFRRPSAAEKVAAEARASEYINEAEALIKAWNHDKNPCGCDESISYRIGILTALAALELGEAGKAREILRISAYRYQPKFAPT